MLSPPWEKYSDDIQSCSNASQHNSMILILDLTRFDYSFWDLFLDLFRLYLFLLDKLLPWQSSLDALLGLL